MVVTSMHYLARDELYTREKPYSAEFEIPEGEDAQKTNYILTSKSVTVNAIQPTDNFTIDCNGFCVLNEDTQLDAEEALSNPGSVESGYLQQLEAILARRFPEYERLEPLEFVVRKRDERFPSDQLAIVTHEQPACLPHSDFSVRGALLQLSNSFPGQESYFEGKEFDMINVWRPLVGPNDDWPLALCDYTSIDTESDVISSDRLHEDRVGENRLLFPSEKHRWYYLEQQRTDQLLVFRNTDSTGRRAYSFHAAFFNPNSKSPPRQSCEARFVAIR